MAQRHYTLPLQDATFPMLSEQQERTIIGGSDKTDVGAGAKPSIYYCHNVMPTAKGVNSVSYEEVIPFASPAVSNFSDARTLYASDRSRLNMAWALDGTAYVLEEGATGWTKLPDTSPSTISASFSIENVTVGTVNGITYIWYLGVGCFTYNISTHLLTSVTLTGISIANALGIVGSSGYLLAYTDQAIAWSSTVDPTDFTPSTVTGAGGGNVAEIDGAIKFILANPLGIIVYAAANSVAATYTGNVQYPFKFRPVDDSGGGLSLDLVAYEANSSMQFAFTTSGLQSITSQKAVTVLPEVTDFLAGERFEDFDESTKEFTQTDLTAVMKKKVKLIASRYLVISYGISSFTHALVYDIALKRLGKLKVTHVDCFEFIGEQVEIAKKSLAFLSANGTIEVLDFSTAATSTGVVILGKLQYTRGRTITLQGVDVETIKTASTLELTSLVSLDGKTTTKTVGEVSYTAEGIRKYSFRVTAMNHALLFLGKFQLTTVFITYTLNGRR